MIIRRNYLVISSERLYFSQKAIWGPSYKIVSFYLMAEFYHFFILNTHKTDNLSHFLKEKLRPGEKSFTIII